MFVRRQGRPACMDAVAYIKAARSAGSDESAASRLRIPPGQYPVTKSLGNGLLVNYLVDAGHRFTYVSYDSMSDASLTEEDLHRTATSNLAKIAESRLSVRAYDGFYVVTMGGHFEASLLLIDDLWNGSFRSVVPGQYVVAIPARDILAFGDAASGPAMGGLRALIQRSRENHVDHRITDTLYVRSGAVWQPFEDSGGLA
jgi:hypothetical protein